MLKITSTLIALLLSFCVHAQEMTIKVWKPGMGSIVMNINSYIVQLEGTIDAGAPARLQAQLDRLPRNQTTYYLNSPGGNLAAGLQLGRIIRKTGISTNVGTFNGEGEKPSPGVCYSSCSLTFLGGLYRYPTTGSRYGVHRFSSTSSSPRDLELAQIVSSQITAYMKEMDVDTGLFDLMATASKDEIYVLTTKQMVDLNVVNNGRLKPRWSIDAIDNTLYLRGEQSTVWGLGRLLFVCGKGVVMTAITGVDREQAASMQRGEWLHSMLLDSETSPLEGDKKAMRYDGNYLFTYNTLSVSQARGLSMANSIGYAMQISREAPSFVGLMIDVPQQDKGRISAFVSNCRQ
nr:hypothetical protein [uncultured Albidiferax sp.]